MASYHSFTVRSVCLAASLGIGAVHGESTTLHVPGSYTTIQAAIEAAIDGDTVLVAEGTYLENLLLRGKKITLASHYILDGNPSHIDRTIIDGSQPETTDTASVLMIDQCEQAPEVCGFTITAGYGTRKVWSPTLISRGGGGVLIVESSAYIHNNRIVGNTVSPATAPDPFTDVLGGGVLLYTESGRDVSFQLTENLIAHNEIAGEMSGGAGMAMEIFGTGVTDYLIEKNVIEHNTARNTDDWKAMGGGMFVQFFLPTRGTQIIQGNVLRHNEVHAPFCFGGAMYVVVEDPLRSGMVDTTATPYIANNLICHNHSDYLGGAIAVWRRYFQLGQPHATLTSKGHFVPKPSFVNNTIVHNTAQDGAGFYIMNHTPLLLNNIVWNDYPVDAQWGEVFLGDEPRWLQMLEANSYGDAEIHYTEIRGGWEGSGNLDAEPLFIAGDSLYSLLPDPLNPPVNSGADSLLCTGILYCSPGLDRQGDVRPYPGTRPDVGADETDIVGSITFGGQHQSPSSYTLDPNYPNPFNPTTTIDYALPQAGYATLKVYSVLGEEVATLIDGEQSAGTFTTEWDASGLPSGVYFYRLTAGEYVQARKMVLMR